MSARRGAAGTAMAAAAFALAGCLSPEMTAAPTPPPQTAPAAAPAPPERTEPALRDSEIARYYRRVEASRRADGLMRTDGGGADTPFTPSMVVENFIRIALYDEYVMIGGRPVARETPAALRRWENPVRMRLEFGESVPETMRRQDRALVGDYAARLGELTGHPVSLVGERGNFHVLVLSEDERRRIGPRMRQLVPGVDDDTVRLVETMPRSTFCLVLAFSRAGTDVYTDAIAVIRAEHPDLTRTACYHEELAQGLGLPNDSSQARPSIFNDRQEFALLTPHDELLLQLLYDPRLRPGMRAAQARPIVRRIVDELMGAES